MLKEEASQGQTLLLQSARQRKAGNQRRAEPPAQPHSCKLSLVPPESLRGRRAQQPLPSQEPLCWQSVLAPALPTVSQLAQPLLPGTPRALFKEESLHQHPLNPPPPVPQSPRGAHGCLLPPACSTQKGAGELWGSGAVLKESAPGARASAPVMPSSPFLRRQQNKVLKGTKGFFIENNTSQWINSPRKTQSRSNPSAWHSPGMSDRLID